MTAVRQPPPKRPLPVRVALAIRTVLFKALRWFFMLLMVIIPVPIVSFFDKARQRQQKNPAAQVLKEDQEP